MAFDPETKHSLYISRTVWEELKIRSVQEHRTASEMIATLLAAFIREQPAAPQLKRYQPRLEDPIPGERTSRSVYVPAGIWDKTLELSAAGHYSVTGLVDDLLKSYLGLLPVVSAGEQLPYDSSTRYVMMGGNTFDLGESPIHIDLGAGDEKPRGYRPTAGSAEK